MTTAPTVRRNTSRFLEVTNQSRLEPTKTPQVPSSTRASAVKIAPKIKSWIVIDPTSGSTNCGNTAEKNTKAFGFNAPTVNP